MSHSQEFGQPHIQVYLPGPYKYVDQYNSIVQDEEGFLYLGSGEGILRFDGNTWNHIHPFDKVMVLSSGSGLFALSRTRFGSLGRNPAGEPEIHSLYTDPSKSGKIIQAIQAGKDIYLLTDKGLYRWDEELQKVELPFLPQQIFYDGTALLLYSKNAGLYQLMNHEAKQVIEARDIPLGEVCAAVKTGDQWILVDQTVETIILYGQGLPGSNFTRLIMELKDAGYSCARFLSDGTIAWGTKKAGVIISNALGQIQTHISREDGLYDNHIVDLYTDATDNLWVLHDQALSRVEIPSAFTFFGRDRGLPGNITDMLRFDGSLYASSNHGLYRLAESPGNPDDVSGRHMFSAVTGVPYNTWQLISTEKTILAATERGIFEIKALQSRKISDNVVNVLHYSARKEVLFAGTDEGLLLMSTSDWSVAEKAAEPDYSIYDIHETEEGFLWLASKSGEIFRSAEPIQSGKQLSFISFPPETEGAVSGQRTIFFTVHGHLRIARSGGIYLFHPQTKELIPDSIIDLTSIKSPFYINHIVGDDEGKLWIGINHPGTNQNDTYIANYDPDSRTELHHLSYRRIQDHIINCYYPEQDQVTWIGSHKGLIRFDLTLSVNTTNRFSTHIAEVSLDNDRIVDYDALRSVNYQEAHRKGLMRIPYSGNSIGFKYLSMDFNSESRPLFQYKLSGIQDQWSDWSPTAMIEFSSLNRGRYSFMVRSKDNFGSVSRSDVFEFRIMPPLYASIWGYIFYSMLFLLLFYFFQKWRTYQHVRERYKLEEIIEERTEALIKEKEKTDTLLANILPKKTADELKLTGKATSSKFKMVTVLFADIQGFTKIAEQMNPEKLIDELDRFYFHFDSVVEKYNIEKIKTIGDAYMAAGGIPIKNRTNPVEVVLAALEMQQFMHDLKKEKAEIWDLRIGIHTGSVIAGVVGQKKFSYDIWGDSVNTASRMESSGEIGKVNISATTYSLVKELFQCEYRGKMPVKYKGDIEMYFVKGLNEELAEADKTSPNEGFLTRIQLLRLMDLEEFILQKLKKELPDDMFFHNVQHTHHVYTQVELLGRGEKVSDEDMLILRTAALLHDTGYIDHFDEHEERSVEFAKEFLPLYRYKENQIDHVCELIMATKLPSQPKNLLEQIISDANLDHLGRVDFLIQSDKLFQEYRVRHKVKTKKEWNHQQINFLKTHTFHTNIANKFREVSGEQQIENIKQFS